MLPFLSPIPHSLFSNPKKQTISNPSFPIQDLHACMLSHSVTSYSLQPHRPQCRRRRWRPTPVLLPGKSHGWRSLVGCSPWGRKESDTAERLHFHFSISCTGGRNGTPLQCSCLEDPRVGGAWWAAVCGVAQSRARLKRLSSSSRSQSSRLICPWDSPGKNTGVGCHFLLLIRTMTA